MINLSLFGQIKTREDNYFNSHTHSFSRFQCNDVMFIDSAENQFRQLTRSGRDSTILFHEEGMDTVLVLTIKNRMVSVKAYTAVKKMDGDLFEIKGWKPQKAFKSDTINAFKAILMVLSDTSYEKNKLDYNEITPKTKIKGVFGGKFFCLQFPASLRYENGYDPRSVVTEFLSQYYLYYRKK